MRAMVVPLKSEELVNSRDGGGVHAPEPYSRTTGHSVGRVSNSGRTRSHLTSSRNLTSMHETGQREVAPAECADDPLHVSSNPGHTGGICPVSPEYDAATIRHRFELVT